MKDLVARIFEHAERSPSREALSYEGTRLTYGGLREAVEARSSALQRWGVAPDVLVGIAMERSIELVVSVIAVLHAGGGYIPFDLAHPDARLDRIREASAVERILVDASARGRAPLARGTSWPELLAATNGGIAPVAAAGDEHLAYVMFTSGSTGAPKGVAMERGPLRRLVEWHLATERKRDARTAHFAAIGFDVSFQEIFSTLCGGGSLVIVSDARRQDVDGLISLLRGEEVERLFLPTAALYGFAERARTVDLPCLSTVVCAGEQLRITPAVRAFFGRAASCRLHNHYGPTEAHVVTSYVLEGPPDAWPELVPIGRPLPHVTLLVDDELLIGGACLARGYYGRPELTRERFVERSGARFYRTGDDVEVDARGVFHFRGRRDGQVKVRGHRVELAEVEAALSSAPHVVACAADVRADGTEARLVAWVIAGAGESKDALARQWSQLLAARLPPFMVPTTFHFVDQIPVTANGKVDRSALVEPPRRRPPLVTAFASPANERERRIAEIWQTVLGLDRVGVEDRFFDLGGTSLTVTRVIVALEHELGEHIPTATFFEHPTVRGLARATERGNEQTVGKATVRHKARPPSGDIAIVGMACRFPGADTPSAFWANLVAGVDLLGKEGVRAEGERVVAGGTLRDIDRFDAACFGMSPGEAEITDPQHRLFLECSWEALEDANVDPARHAQRIGVFAGCGPSTYLLNNVHPARFKEARSFVDESAEVQLLIANDKDFLASRVSYKLDLRGPSVAVNGACATALVAVHLARRAILDGDCDMAIAGAAFVPVPQLDGYTYEPGMVLSPDGRCRPFDERAQGTVFSSGVGAVVLKPLELALQDGDDVYAVIKGSAVNNDGATKAGMSAPSPSAQAEVIAAALDDAGIDPATIGYVEAHGTATEMGDPIEVRALRRAYGDAGTLCALGSVKSNMGHAGWASGMAGLIKAALAVRYGTIPATLHCERPNPRIDFGRFSVTRAASSWSGEGPRRAGVSAFGLGGVNAHVVLEAPREIATAHHDDGPELLLLSAGTPEALAAGAERMATRLTSLDDMPFKDVVQTSALRRPMPVRLAVVAADARDAAAELRARAEDCGRRVVTRSPRVAALFSGQGADYFGMGKALYERYPAFRSALDRCSPSLVRELGADAPTLMFGARDDGALLVENVSLAQPLLFAFQTSLVALLRAWGVELSVVMGHSLGEFAAAATAGVFDVEAGMALTMARGRLIHSHTDEGGMAAVALDEARLRARLAAHPRVAIAAVNGPESAVVSGPRAAVLRCCQELEASGVKVRLLPVNRAGHSETMDAILERFGAELGGVPLTAPQMPLVSNLTGRLVEGDEVASPDYWTRHLRSTVRFADGVRSAAALGIDVFLEIGPGAVLIGPASSTHADPSSEWVATSKAGEELAQLWRAMGKLYEVGAPLDWEAIVGRPARRAHLPTYAFQRERHWVDAPKPNAGRREHSGVAASLLHQVAWRSMPSPLASGAATRDVWLVLARGEDGRALARALRGRGQRVVTVCHHDGPVRHEGDDVAANITQRDSLVEVLRAFPEATQLALVTSADGLAVSETREGLLAAPSAAMEAAASSLAPLLATVQALDVTGSRAKPSLVTRLACGARESDVVECGQASVTGLLRVTALEHPEQEWIHVDLDDGDDRALACAAETLTGPRNECRVAVRGGERFVPRIVPDASSSNDDHAPTDGTHLVVGGTRGLGLLTAEHLVARGVSHVVLVGRRAPEPAASERIERMRARGAHVDVVCLDISQPEAVDDLLGGLAARAAWVTGVLFAAATLDDGILRGLTWERFPAVLAPKVAGAWNLHVLLEAHRHPVRTFVLYSSITSLVGNSGQASYGAANAFLDALAYRRHARGLAGVSIAWGPWADAGFVAENEAVAAHLTSLGMGTVSARAGLRAYDALAMSRTPHVGVFELDWEKLGRAHDLTRVSLLADLTRAPARRSHDAERALRQEIARAGEPARRERVRALITSRVRRVLRGAGDALDPSRRFADYGLDSLSAIQIRNGIQSDLACALRPNACFQFPSVDALAEHIVGDVLGEAWRERWSGAGPPEETHATSMPAALAAVPVASASRRELSRQQLRWLRLGKLGYGRLVVPVVFHVALDRDVFAAALRDLVARHEILRWRFAADHAVVVDTDEAIGPMSALFEDLSDLAAEPMSVALTELAQSARSTMPDPTRGVSWRVKVVALPRERFLLLLSAQHLEMDGVGVSIFIDELRDAYHRFSRGGAPAADAETAPPYAAFVSWQKTYASGPDIALDRAFFNGLYATSAGPTLLPGQADLRVTTSHESLRYTPPSHRNVWRRLQRAADVISVSPFAYLMAVYMRLLGEITGDDDVTVGTIVTGRREEFFRTLGSFVAPFPVSVSTRGRSVEALARECNRVVVAINARCTYPASDLAANVEAFSGLPMDTYFTDPFIMFNNYERESSTKEPFAEVLECLAPVARQELTGLDAPSLPEIAGLFLIVDIIEGEPRFNFWYHQHRFSRTHVEGWGNRYLKLLDHALAAAVDEERPVGEHGREKVTDG